jgi:hypothetical protein
MPRLELDAVYLPLLDGEELRPILASHPPRGEGRGAVTFCVDECGRFRNVHTTMPVPGLPELDALLRNHVRKWRVSPSAMREQPTKVCARYEVHFTPPGPHATTPHAR